MDRNSNTYTFIFSIIMVVVVAVVLSFIALKLQPRQEQNIRIEKKRNILSAINIESTAKTVGDIFDNYIIEQFAVDYNGNILEDIDAFELEMSVEIRKERNSMTLPVFKAKMGDNSIRYIFALHGRGLWGPIWGYIALYDDMKTVYGAYFSHQAETPGLGAEIDTKEFQRQFNNKHIFNNDNKFVSVNVVKGGLRNPNHEVDAISGGTITCNGLSDMIYDCLSLYLEFIERKKKN